MANQRELNSYHNHSFEEMVDLITEKDEKIEELLEEISDLKKELDNLKEIEEEE